MEKIFFIFCLIICSFCVGQQAVSGLDANDPKFRMNERRLLLKEYLKDARNLVEDSEANTICDFLEREAVVIAPFFSNGKVRFIVGESAKSKNCILVMFVFKEDLSLSESFTNVMAMNHIGASYNPDTRILVVKTWHDVSKSWRSFLFLHEGRHAYESIVAPYDWKDSELFCLHERTTHEFENRLIAKVGGDLYESIMRKQIKELELGVAVINTYRGQLFLEDFIVSDLDKIFGKSKSEFERNLRYMHFWIDKYFRFFDKECKTKTEAGQAKDGFLYNVYLNNGALNN